MTQWESQVVDNNQLTTISELTPHTIYTIRVQAFTSVGPGPLSAPVHVKTQQGMWNICKLSFIAEQYVGQINYKIWRGSVFKFKNNLAKNMQSICSQCTECFTTYIRKMRDRLLTKKIGKNVHKSLSKNALFFIYRC